MEEEEEEEGPRSEVYGLKKVSGEQGCGRAGDPHFLS